mmetsp:Transcript_3886/g.3848  ORF Transcript_3886/g.3848 Transcript_3886/m.3848 type:complete len:344 (-) Transcript_3886:118-1149(-)
MDRNSEVELKEEIGEGEGGDSVERIYKQAGPDGEEFEENISIDCQGSEIVGLHKIRVVSWLPGKEKQKQLCGVIIISHGLHEHALRYYKLAHSLTSRGFAVYACDHFGHGKSDGTRGLIPDYNILVNDFIEFGKFVHNKHPDLPISLFSHSMGTLVAMLSIKSLPFLNSVIFSATPLFSGPSASSPFGCTCLYPLSQTSLAVYLTGCMASCAPRGPAAPILIEGITSYQYERDILLADSLRYDGDIMNKTASEAIKMINLCKLEAIPTITIPFLCIHGEEDSVGLPTGSQYIYDHAGTPVSSKSIQFFQLLRHEMLHESPTDTQKVLDVILNFLNPSFVEEDK